MRILTIFTLFFGVNFAFGQNAPITFEPDGFGADWNWTVFENDTNPALEIIDNPDPSGINTSSKVAKFTALESGNPWAGCESTHGSSELGPFVLDETTSTIKIMVWKSVISDVGIKLVSPTGWAQVEIKVANTKINEWEELTFDFSSYVNPPASEGQLDQVVVFPDFNLDGRNQDNIIYFDNITFGSGGGGGGSDPLVAAPTPTLAEDKVISLFSDAYTDVAVDTWRTDWSSAVYEEVEVAGNPTKKYSNLDFVGIETVANQVDATNMTNFYVNVWSSDYTFFAIKLVDFGADGAFGGGDDTEHQVDIEMPAQNQWVTIDIPLTDFVGLTSKTNIAQYILVGRPTGSATVYVDNMLLYDATSVSVGESEKLKEILNVFPNPVVSGQDISLDQKIVRAELIDNTGKSVRISNEAFMNTQGLSAGLYLLKASTQSGNTQMIKIVIQ